MSETKTITIEIEPDASGHPTVFQVEGKTTAGRGELRAALNAAAREAVTAMVDELIPPKGAE